MVETLTTRAPLNEIAARLGLEAEFHEEAPLRCGTAVRHHRAEVCSFLRMHGVPRGATGMDEETRVPEKACFLREPRRRGSMTSAPPSYRRVRISSCGAATAMSVLTSWRGTGGAAPSRR